MSASDLRWAKFATIGDYLYEWEDDGLDATSDPGSRGGRDDRELDEIKGVLRGRGLSLEADDRGLVATGPSIKIGRVRKEWPAVDDNGEMTVYPELDAYLSVEVLLNEERHQVGVCVGIRESDRGSAGASGCGISYGGGPVAWWVDSSDHDAIPAGLTAAVLDALNEEARRLWDEAERRRPSAAAHEVAS